MTEDVSISHLNTQRNANDVIIYNYRDFNSISSFITAISSCYQGRRPILVYQYGLVGDGLDSLAESIQQSANLYSKNNGILLRGVFVKVNKECIGDNKTINILANEFAKYILYKGFVLQYMVYDMNTYYTIIYLINPINYVDGSKYRTNNKDILEHEYACLRQCIDFIKGVCSEYDFSDFETYPLPY